MSRTHRPRRSSRPHPSRREQTPWAKTVLGAAVAGTARAVFTWLLDQISN